MKNLVILAALASPILGMTAALGIWWLFMVVAVAPLAAAAQAFANTL